MVDEWGSSSFVKLFKPNKILWLRVVAHFGQTFTSGEREHCRKDCHWHEGTKPRNLRQIISHLSLVALLVMKHAGSTSLGKGQHGEALITSPAPRPLL